MRRSGRRLVLENLEVVAQCPAWEWLGGLALLRGQVGHSRQQQGRRQRRLGKALDPRRWA